MNQPHIPLREIAALAAAAVQRGADRAWSLADLDFDAVEADRLTEDDRSAVRFVTLIEDHIPGYLGWLLARFPVDNADGSLSGETVAVNREYFRFFVTWAYDEERHAAALTRYQEAAAIAEPEALRLELAEQGRRHFTLPYQDPLSAFTYTLVQEKATQLFYQQFLAVVREPVLADLLRRLIRDEARHFAFYAQLVEAQLRARGPVALHLVKETLASFRMPLSDTLPGYRRWSRRVALAVGYDHTEAYGAVARLVGDFAGARGGGEAEELLRLIAGLRQLPVAGG